MHICYSISCYKTYQNVTSSCSFALTCFIISVFHKIDNFMASLNLVLLCSALCHPNTLLREIWDHLFQTPTYVIKRTSFACFVSGTSTFRNLMLFMLCNHDVFFFSPIRCATRFVKCFFSPKKKTSNMLDHFKKSFLFANKMVANKIPPHSCAASPVFFGAWRLVSVMVHWWFRFVVWIPGIPERERDCYELAYPNSNPKPPVPKPTIRH